MGKRIISSVMPLIFLIYIFAGFFFFISSMIQKEELNMSSVLSYFDDISGKGVYVNLYGAVQHVLGKRQIEDFTIFLNSYGKLVAPREELTETEISEKFDEIRQILDYLNEHNITNLYLESLLPISDERDLPLGVHDNTYSNSALLHGYLDDINTIDLMDVLSGTLQKEQLFYRTDHHWSGDACFETYLAVQEWLFDEGIIESTTFNTENFTRNTVEGFLGSYGIKVGRYYVGREEFVFFTPNFDTDIEFTALTADGVVILNNRAQWEDALMDYATLDDPDYNNKYAASLYGNGGENRIFNWNNPNGGRLLLISHSYGRPLAQYLSLNFSEVRQIDPQLGRFNGNYLTYIEDYQPDVVIFLIEFEGEIIGEYNTTN